MTNRRLHRWLVIYLFYSMDTPTTLGSMFSNLGLQ